MAKSSTHILIVEDDDKLARLYGKVLNHIGYQIRHVTTIEDGLFQLKKFDPDIVCLDWQIGNQVAESLLAYIAALDPQQRPRTILASGRILKHDLMTFTSFVDVIDAVLSKPMVLSDLVETVKKFVRNGVNERQLIHKAEITSLTPDVVLVVWEGRLSNVMVAPMMDVLEDRAVVLDVKACYMEVPPGRKTFIEIEHWQSIQWLYIVHDEDELTLIRTLFSPILPQNRVFLYTNREEAVAAALADHPPESDNEIISPSENGKHVPPP